MTTTDNYRGYRGEALDTLKTYNAQVWSDVEIKTITGSFTGIVLPRSETADPHHIVLKLRSGYIQRQDHDHRPCRRDAPRR